MNPRGTASRPDPTSKAWRTLASQLQLGCVPTAKSSDRKCANSLVLRQEAEPALPAQLGLNCGFRNEIFNTSRLHINTSSGLLCHELFICVCILPAFLLVRDDDEEEEEVCTKIWDPFNRDPAQEEEA